MRSGIIATEGETGERAYLIFEGIFKVTKRSGAARSIPEGFLSEALAGGEAGRPAA